MNKVLREAARPEDAEILADLRVEAMRPSLEAIGRFDPLRARKRFLDQYCSDCTWKLIVGQDLVGFFVIEQKADSLWLNHLYVRPAFQNRGIAAAVMADLKQCALEKHLSIRLMALKGSRSNDFYKNQGFTLVDIQEFDNYYQWCALQH